MDGVEYTYYYMGDKLARLTIGTATVMDFFYDQNGHPYAMKYNNTVLYYVLNQQGDVVRLVYRDGSSYGIYTYDAWGNILYNTDNQWLNNNPLRYRGYVYDPETELYYCQSRYYDPAVGRFINADDVSLLGADGTLLSYNLFAYCGNNPVNKSDPTGEVGIFGILGGMAIGAAASIISDAVAAYISGEKFTIVDAFASGLGGAATGGLIAAGIPAGVAATVGTAVNTAYKGVLNHDDAQTIMKDTLKETGKTAASALLLHGTGKVVQSYVKGKYVKDGLLTKLAQKAVYEPQYLNDQSLKTIAADSFWESAKKVGNVLVKRLLT